MSVRTFSVESKYFMVVFSVPVFIAGQKKHTWQIPAQDQRSAFNLVQSFFPGLSQSKFTIVQLPE